MIACARLNDFFAVHGLGFARRGRREVSGSGGSAGSLHPTKSSREPSTMELLAGSLCRARMLGLAMSCSFMGARLEQLRQQRGIRSEAAACDCMNRFDNGGVN